nr:DUF397 domain-containing protein [Kibdelosporangium sp. MJ126-NF4]CEL16637.1 hypothetical protein [Kibdelosporangium sp. MJ126-NF4]
MDTGWFKSSFSGSNDEGCVEVRITSGSVQVRDTKNRLAPGFAVDNASWQTFLTLVGK